MKYFKFFLLSIFFTNSVLAAPVPSISTSVENGPLIGEDVTLSITLDNTDATDTGFYPYYRFVLPQEWDFTSADCGPYPLATAASEQGPAGGGGASYNDPVTGETIVVGEGERLITVIPGVGQITPDQPAITCTFDLTPDGDFPQTLFTADTITDIRGIFGLGDAPSNTFGTCSSGDTVCSAAETEDITPNLISVTKSAGQSSPTATGPNYAFDFTINGNLAGGETLNNVALDDDLPEEFELSAVDPGDCSTFTINPAATTCTFTPDATDATGGNISITWATLATDFSVVVNGYVKDVDDGAADILNPLTGANTSGTNTVTVDANEFGAPIVKMGNFDINGMDITKSVSIFTDNGSAGATPGDVLQWTVNFKISDYFDINNIEIEDVIGDGQSYVPNSMTLLLSEGGVGVALTEATVEADTATYIDDTYNGGTGETTLDVEISNILDDEDLNPGNNDTLEGTLPGGQAFITMTYRTTILDDYVVNPGGDISIDAGDSVVNDVDVTFDVVGGNAGLSRSASASQNVLRITTLTKDLIKINGADPGVGTPDVQAGDVVTYQFDIVIPAGDVESLVITDYLPKPLFEVPGAMAYNAAADAATPPATGEWGVEANTTSLTINAAHDPTISATNNSLEWDFGTFDDAGGATTTISIVFSVTASFEPIENGLQQVNVVNATYNDSETVAEVPAIGTVELVGLAPDVSVTKSASSTSGDAGDTITYTIAITNNGDRTAFDVEVTDAFPSDADGNLLLPPSNPGNCDEDAGTGGIPDCDYNFTESVDCSDISAPVFDASDEDQIYIDGFSIEAGDTCTITYDVVIPSYAKLDQDITNTVSVLYDNESGGTAAQFPPETAEETFSVNKATVEKDNNPAAATQVVEVGDTIMFDVTITIPEGKMENATLVDLERTLSPNGTQDWWGNPTAVSVTGGLSGAGPYCLTLDADICFENDPTDMGNWDTGDADQFEIDLGDVTNTATDDGVRTATFTVTGLINNNGTEGSKRNRARIQWDNPNGGGTVNDTSANNGTESADVTIDGPEIDMFKCTDTASTDDPIAMTDGDDEVSYRIMAVNNGGSTAFQVTNITDTLPLGLSYDHGGAPATAWYCTSGGAAVTDVSCKTFDGLLDVNCSDVTADMTVTNDGAYPSGPADQQDLEFSVTDGSLGDDDEMQDDGFYVIEFQATQNCTTVVDNSGADSPTGSHPDNDGFNDACTDPKASFGNNFSNTAAIASYNSQPSANPNGRSYGPESDSDSLSRDDDGDGFTNATEGNADADADGVPNYLDTDSDDNGDSDATEGAGDNDGDGTDDYLDVDDDNDGINDGVEISDAGGFGTGGETADADMDGTVNYLDPDSDNDGIADGSEADGDTARDTDGDGNVDYQDLDSDNDGIPDVIEYGLGTFDTNDDGELSGAEITASGLDANSNGSIEEGELTTDESNAVATLPDFDSDGTPDARDLDSDDDGLPDLDEAGSTVSDLDVNNDNEITEAERLALGGDGIVNLDDLNNSDNDVLGTFGPTGDGFEPDYLDIDSDNDGVADVVENGREVCDINDDGAVTSAEGNACGLNGDADDFVFASESTPTNTDGAAAGDLTSDATPDYADRDSDGDGIADWIEAHTNDQIDPTVGVDYDGDDGATDGYVSDEALLIIDSTNLVNTDATGSPDMYDTDADDDGIDDLQESGSSVADYTTVPGTPSYDTSTPITLYAGMFETDPGTDNLLDFRDLDSDDDGVTDATENGMGANPLDTNLDGEPDFQDIDSDGDGLDDEDETTEGTDRINEDSDGDGCGDGCEVFGSNNGGSTALVCHLATSTDPTTIGEIPGSVGDFVTDPNDSDTDDGGVNDCVEAQNNKDPLLDPDDDGDIALDNDGDGLTNGEETFNVGSNPNDATTPDDPGCAGVVGCNCNDGCKVFGNIPAGCPFDNGQHDTWYAEGTYTVDAPFLDPTDLTNDADGDGCSDCFEGAVTFTNPHAADTDGDTIGDCVENAAGMDPLSTDSDGDGCSDTCEVFGTGPDCDVSDSDWFTQAGTVDNPLTDPLSDADADGDDVKDCAELQTHLTDPNNEDTDGGGIDDGFEINTFGSDPLDRLDDCPNEIDTDGDGLTDCEEIDLGSDPLSDDGSVTIQGSGTDGLFWFFGCQSRNYLPWLLFMVIMLFGRMIRRQKEGV